ncbi:MAG: hypothetical protein JW734_07605 [Candidatus Omnitrophica bacterium]|nr:hypothetical protein [Candidatus Omnitrophota bacterium]
MSFLSKISTLPKEKAYILSLLFALSLFQYLHITFLTNIDFLLLGLIFYAYFINTFWLATTTTIILLIYLFTSGQFHPFMALTYFIIPISAKKISSILNLNFPKFFYLCASLVSLYILAMLIKLNVLSLKNIFYAVLQNIAAGWIIYIAFGYAFSLKEK